MIAGPEQLPVEQAAVSQLQDPCLWRGADGDPDLEQAFVANALLFQHGEVDVSRHLVAVFPRIRGAHARPLWLGFTNMASASIRLPGIGAAGSH